MIHALRGKNNMSGKKNWGDNMTDRRDGKTPPPITDPIYKTPSKVWKKKYKCKKNKGDHTPVIALIKYCGRGWTQQKDGIWIPNTDQYFFSKHTLPYCWVQWECTGCKKLMIEWGVPDKKFDKYRP